VKIIKQGRLPQDRVWEATCYFCKTQVEAQESELEVHDDQRDGPWAGHPCPMCGKQMSFRRTERFVESEAAAEPKAPRTCVKCGRPENAHNMRHPFVATGGAS